MNDAILISNEEMLISYYEILTGHATHFNNFQFTIDKRELYLVSYLFN